MEITFESYVPHSSSRKEYYNLHRRLVKRASDQHQISFAKAAVKAARRPGPTSTTQTGTSRCVERATPHTTTQCVPKGTTSSAGVVLVPIAGARFVFDFQLPSTINATSVKGAGTRTANANYKTGRTGQSRPSPHTTKGR